MPADVRRADRPRQTRPVFDRVPPVSVRPVTRAGAGRVLVATFVTLGLTYGFWYSYAVFLVAFLRELGWRRSVVAGAFSLLVMVHGLSGPLLGRGGALGAWVAGVIFDAAASYALALPIAATMALLAPTLLWFVAPRRPNPAPSA